MLLLSRFDNAMQSLGKLRVHGGAYSAVRAGTARSVSLLYGVFRIHPLTHESQSTPFHVVS
jgi:hypothetical protein